MRRDHSAITSAVGNRFGARPDVGAKRPAERAVPVPPDPTHRQRPHLLD